MTEYAYAETITNDYLGLSEEIKAPSALEGRALARDRLKLWAEEEARRRERDSIGSGRSPDGYENQRAREEIERYRNIFVDSLKTDPGVDWVSLYDDSPFEPFVFREAPPSYKKVAGDLNVPPKTLWEIFLPSLRRKRLSREDTAKRVFLEKMKQYEERKEIARQKHEEERLRYAAKQNEFNESVESLRFSYETAKPQGIEGYVRLVLAKSHYPAAIKKEYEVFFDRAGRTVVINYLLPGAAGLPGGSGRIYRDGDGQAVALEMDGEEFWEFYRSVQVQIAVRTISEVFRSDYKKHIANAVFNGWLLTADNGAEKEFAWCYLSCKASRELAESLDVDSAAPEEIFKAFRGVMAVSLKMGDAVQPLVNMITENSRFAGPPGEDGRTP
ncbi:MAG: hypothetical protein K6T80_03565 [Firmicutes bacterium]|nr:hypothetical protein [Bacillota bacterium]